MKKLTARILTALESKHSTVPELAIALNADAVVIRVLLSNMRKIGVVRRYGEIPHNHGGCPYVVWGINHAPDSSH